MVTFSYTSRRLEVKHMSIKLEKGQPGHLLLSFDYDEEIINKVKTIQGIKWNADIKKWILPDNLNTKNKIVKLFSYFEIIDCREQATTVDKPSEDILMEKLERELKLRGF